YVSQITPRYGSLAGGTTITIQGSRFSRDSFNHFPGTEHLGNRVDFVYEQYVFPCDVITVKSTPTRIFCVTRDVMPQKWYYIRVTVDGEISTCSSYLCKYLPYSGYTPTINEITPSSGPPGTSLTIRGQLFTSKYGLNTSTNGDTDSVLRVIAGGDICNLTASDSQSNGIVLDNSGQSSNGVMTCKLSESGSQLGNINVSYALSGRGRSQSNMNLYRVSRNGQIFMFQSYAEIHSITPSSGSTEGGTVITISGRYFDETKSSVMLKLEVPYAMS
ncbi:fibrocystin-L-like, partial [Argopecten irradians]|uniref:fibrocystin-L-like n=1 Tax=Argopecten irradians TaxID=31199 RepID=UPI003711198F